MLPIPPPVLGCCIYIYPSVASADSDQPSRGGAGVAIGVRLSANPEATQVYVVTNRHVIDEMSAPVLRLNKQNGGFDVIQTSRHWWKDHLDGDDLSALEIDFDPDIHDFYPVMADIDLCDQTARGMGIFPGDEVFMVSRFFNQEGSNQNTPAARFGYISMLPIEPIKNKWGFDQESFLVEQRSLPGCSGSPVFILIDPAKPRPPEWLTFTNRPWSQERFGPWLLGIDWCHINSFEEVRDDDPPRYTISKPAKWVKSNTGMAGVIPAWRVMQLLNRPDFVAKRQKEDAERTENKKVASHISYDSVPDAETKDFTQADFESALRKVSRKIEPHK